MPRMRTIKESVVAIKELDPKSAIAEWLVRNLCKDGRVKCLTSGNKILVNLDDLIDFLSR